MRVKFRLTSGTKGREDRSRRHKGDIEGPRKRSQEREPSKYMEEKGLSPQPLNKEHKTRGVRRVPRGKKHL